MSASRLSKRRVEERSHSISPPPTKRKLESTITNKEVANFFTPSSKKEPDQIKWKVVGNSLLVAKCHFKDTFDQTAESGSKRRKIAAFDFDSTIIQTSSGNISSKSPSDWKWWHISVPSTLRKLVAEGYVIAILSNQAGISLKNDPKTLKIDQKNLSKFKVKVGIVLGQLSIPIILLAATAHDRFRKPRTGMWQELLEEIDLDEHDGGPDLAASFFVGDAGGRPAKGVVRADHSCSDRNFAVNVGIQFKTPEEYFCHEAPQAYTREFDPNDYIGTCSSTSILGAPLSKIVDKSNSIDIVLLCGSPGSGKSTFYSQCLKSLGYERVNQDILKTRERCIKVAADFISRGNSVTIDNTNADVDTRASWVKLASKLGVPIRCVYFTAPPQLCRHNDTVRALGENDFFNPEKRSILPQSAFSSYTARFKEPKTSEGFQDIITVDFQFSGGPEERRIWSQYWI